MECSWLEFENITLWGPIKLVISLLLPKSQTMVKVEKKTGYFMQSVFGSIPWQSQAIHPNEKAERGDMANDDCILNILSFYLK